MTTSTWFLAENNGEFKAGDDSLVGCVLEAASYEGWGAAFARLGDDGEEDPQAPMRLYQSPRQIGNNAYFPVPKDAYYPSSSLLDDDAAQAELAKKLSIGQMFHNRDSWSFYELTYTNDVLTHVDARPLIELVGTFGDCIEDVVRRFDVK